MSIRETSCTVLSNKAVADGIFEMELSADRVDDILGGQFVNIKLPTSDTLLRRPFCLCDFDERRKSFTICYAVVGKGTETLSHVKTGEVIKATLPLGNGWDPRGKYSKIMLVGGGMGSAVLPAVARRSEGVDCVCYLGFADKSKAVLEDRLRSLCSEVVVATDNGSYGRKGFVTDVVAEDIIKSGVEAVFCCGPEVMYKALKRALASVDIPVYISLEQRMGCGIGACLVCNCMIERDGKQGYYRVCKDGPVFELAEVVL
ncbi:MAG: dihydroorotate dehydrogenase electron transfer subunit [Christensenellales bacterium]